MGVYSNVDYTREINMSFSEQSTIISARMIAEYGAEIALLRRASTGEFAGAWELPGGKINPGEDIAAGVLREAQEEMGVPVELLPFQPVMIDNRPILDGKHMGKWYTAYGYIGTATSRELTLDPDEHEDAMWLTVDEALAMPTLSLTSRKTLIELGMLSIAYTKKPSI